MAGHSKFANIKHRKEAQDKKRAKLFTRLTKEIIVAASNGQTDPGFNPRLRLALSMARKAGVPKDKIDYAVKKGAGEIEGESFEEIRYEGYGPGGVALIIDVTTDNRNRSASEVRSTLTKAGGSLGETGSVNFMFDRVGRLVFELAAGDADTVFETALEAGASNCETSDDGHEITCEADDFNTVRDALVDKLGDPEEAGLAWLPKDPMPIDDAEKAQKILDAIEKLEDIDDVQDVSANMDIPDEVAQKLAS